MRRSVIAVMLMVVAGCLSERGRPTPYDPDDPARLTTQITAPLPGASVRSGSEVTVTVQARDLTTGNLAGVGFYARRFGPGFTMVDSAAIRFAARSDTTHEFTFTVPASFVTNTQIDIYGISFSAAGGTHVSQPRHVVVVQCQPGQC